MRTPFPSAMPANDSDDAELTRRARRRVGIKTGFYIHLAVYLLVNLGLLALNAAIGGHRWHVWPLAGWGIGLAVHGIVTFLSLRGDGLRDQLVAHEVERLKGRR